MASVELVSCGSIPLGYHAGQGTASMPTLKPHNLRDSGPLGGTADHRSGSHDATMPVEAQSWEQAP